MRCVKETLPPRERLRWLLMTMRLSDSSLAGTARTEVAVGIDSELSMFFTTRAAAPLSGVDVGPFEASGSAAAGAWALGAWAFDAWALGASDFGAADFGAWSLGASASGAGAAGVGS